MIRKSMPSGHDPMGGYRFFRKRSCSNKKMERDDDSKKSHPALDVETLQSSRRLRNFQLGEGGGSTAPLARYRRLHQF
jgi:hypothetical protein